MEFVEILSYIIRLVLTLMALGIYFAIGSGLGLIALGAILTPLWLPYWLFRLFKKRRKEKAPA